MFRRRGPGLVRAAATTAVVAGTAGAVRHRQDQKYAAQDQAQYDEQMAQQQAEAPPPAAPAADDKFAQLEKLAELQKQGILTDEEFAAEKAKILAS
jgi:membrane protease subunit (stomatin/prohibitin family)